MRIDLGLSGDAVAEARIVADRAGERPWRGEARAAFDRQLFGRTIVRDADFSLVGAFDGARFDGTASGAATVSAAAVGRLRVKDAPVALEAPVVVDLNERLVTIAPTGEGCARVEDARLRVLEQDMEARLKGARLCADGAPLVDVNWNGAPGAAVRGDLRADWGSYRLGETTLVGAPPTIDLKANYSPDDEVTVVEGDFRGGSIIVNEGLRAAQSRGSFQARLIGDALSGEGVIDEAIVSEPREIKTISPLRVTGAGALKDEMATFDVNVLTLKNALVGEGVGAHDVAAGEGAMSFTAEDLFFSPSGLQPDDIVAAFTGMIRDATGGLGADLEVAWNSAGVTSSGTVALADLSFQGPGLAVTRTIGLDGAIVFDSFAPARTAGEQSIRIGGIDLDALQLKDGEARFNLTGDETMTLIEASFPWFGGEIGVYDSQIALSGERALVTFKAENVDLGALLGQLEVEGLSGEGAVEGVLPIVFEDGRARVDGGVLSAVGPGVIRYEGEATDAAAQSSDQANIAFEALRELKFVKLSTTIDGPLDGTLDFKIFMEGESAVPLSDARVKEKVTAPVIYRINLEAPLLALLDQARLSTDVRLQFERARTGEEARTSEEPLTSEEQ